MTLFDGYVAIDWSANATPKTGKDSIWIAVCDEDGPPRLENPNTRQAAMERIKTLLDEATANERRLLCGFDFPFGYPSGTAQMLTGENGWEAVWRRVAEVIVDHPNNANNRFEAAAALNEAFPGEGPFWGLPARRQIEGILANGPNPWGPNLPPDRRYAERLVPQAQEVWRLFYPGSVGSQALMGIASLERLRQGRTDIHVWPFETLGEGERHVLAEIYPSLIQTCPGDEVLDARQVEAVAEALRELDLTGQLAGYLQAPLGMPVQVRHEEALFLGVHAQAGFQAVAQQTPCR